MADDIPILKDTLKTRDENGNEIIIYPKTSDDQVKGLDKYAKSLSVDSGTLIITNGDGSTYSFYLEIDGELISDEEISILFDIEDSRYKYY